MFSVERRKKAESQPRLGLGAAPLINTQLQFLALPTIITGLDKFCFHAEVSKPRRGGLFIDTETPPDFSFCFSAARMWSNRAYMNTSTDGSSGQDIAPVAPPKNKKKIGGGVVSIYKQATPTGFSRRGRSVIGRS